MRFFALGSALLLWATGAMATIETPEDDFVGELSSHEYQSGVQIDGDNLTCRFQPGNNGYIPVTWATASLVVPNYDRNHVLQHATATLYETADQGDPESLCAEIERLKESAVNSYVAATNSSVVRVALVPRYGRGCAREIIEEITITISDRLVFKAINMRILSGGSDDSEDCLRAPPIF
jgi:hypothetical protein